MTPEEKVLLLFSLFPSTPGTIASVQDIISGGPFDYGRLVGLAGTNGVSPLLYLNLSTLQGIPELPMNELRKAYLRTVKENVVRGAEVMRLLTSFKKRDIEVIPLKGPIASDIIFGNPGLYPSGDIDFLVHPSDLQRTKQVLLEEGYNASVLEEGDMLRCGYHLIFEKGRNVLEVHWKLSFRYFDIPPEFWWEDIRIMKYQDTEVLMLSPERYLLYAIFRLYSHAFRPLRFLIFVAALLRSYRQELDWVSLSIFSEKFRMARLVSFTLKLLREFQELNVPETMVKRRLFGYRGLKRLVFSGLFHEVGKIHPRMLLFTALQQTPLDTIKILSERIFPSLSEIRLRYHLPAGSKKVYGYYLLNPLLMIMRKRG